MISLVSCFIANIVTALPVGVPVAEIVRIHSELICKVSPGDFGLVSVKLQKTKELKYFESARRNI